MEIANKCSLCDKKTTSKQGAINSILLTKERVRELYSYAGILKYIIDKVSDIDIDYDNDAIIDDLAKIAEENPLMKDDLEFLEEIHSFVKIDGMPL